MSGQRSRCGFLVGVSLWAGWRRRSWVLVDAGCRVLNRRGPEKGGADVGRGEWQVAIDAESGDGIVGTELAMRTECCSRGTGGEERAWGSRVEGGGACWCC